MNYQQLHLVLECFGAANFQFLRPLRLDMAIGNPFKIFKTMFDGQNGESMLKIDVSSELSQHARLSIELESQALKRGD